MRRHLVTALLCALTASLIQAGCHPDAESSPADDHLEHHIPEHRPADFAEGVAQIQRRLAQLAAHSPGSMDDDFERQATELREIIEWIPDLAGDSDMKKAEWDQVNAAARELLQTYDRALPQLRQGDGSAVTALAAPLGRLHTLAQTDSTVPDRAPLPDETQSLPGPGAVRGTPQ